MFVTHIQLWQSDGNKPYTFLHFHTNTCNRTYFKLREKNAYVYSAYENCVLILNSFSERMYNFF